MNVDLAQLSRRTTAHLARKFGAKNFDDLEDSVQDAIAAALRTWPIHGVPDKPAAWLLKVAGNRLVDRWSSGARYVLMPDAALLLDEPESFTDDELKLLLLCCHPAISEEDQIAFTLKTVAGLGNRQIARAFLLEEATVAQRIVRAKARLRAEGAIVTLPHTSELAERMDAAHRVLYLIFSEGYSTTEGGMATNADMCLTAMSLLDSLMLNPFGESPTSHALAALFCFSFARLPARIAEDGSLLTLEDQDRTQYDSGWRERGLRHMSKCATGRVASVYHALAAISAEHTLAKSFSDTRWERIVEFYEHLLLKEPSPVHRVGYAIAVAMLKGHAQGLRELRSFAAPRLSSYFAAMAWMEEHLGLDASESKKLAASLTKNEAERKFLLSA